MKVKGIIMAGGKGTRLKPLTNILNKHLLPVYNKPMIYYSLSTLIYAGIKDILIICNKGDEFYFSKILSNVIKRNKIKISYEFQLNIGGGIAEGLILAKSFIHDSDKVILMLGDNFFFGRYFPQLIQDCFNNNNKSSYIFLSKVSNPKDYGIAYFKNEKLKKIVEKPKNIKNNLAVTGLYIYHRSVLNLVNSIKPSKRNELEITSLNNKLLQNKLLKYVNIGRGTTWYDLGSYENMLMCSEFVRMMEIRQGIKICDI